MSVCQVKVQFSQGFQIILLLGGQLPPKKKSLLEFDWPSGLEAEVIKWKKKLGEEKGYTSQGCEQSQFQLTTGKIPRPSFLQTGLSNPIC